MDTMYPPCRLNSDFDSLTPHIVEQHLPTVPLQITDSSHDPYRVPGHFWVTAWNGNDMGTLLMTDPYSACMFEQDPIHEPRSHIQHTRQPDMDVRHNATRPLGEAHKELKRPTASDWARWRDKISKKYKTCTGDMIRKELRREGFDVTDKMLRMRFRQWGINRKNKRPVRAHSTLAAASSPVGRNCAANILSTLLERPVTTSPEDFIQRRFLKAIDDYLEYAWQLELDLYEGVDVASALNIGPEIAAAASCSSQYAWSALKKAANTLQEKGLDRISPLVLVALFEHVLSWVEPRNLMEREICKTFCDYLSSAFGARHPVVMAVALIAQDKLDLPSWLSLLRISDARFYANSSTVTEQRQLIIEWSRECYIRVLGRYNELQIMEDVLDSWSPAGAGDKINKFFDLAIIRTVQGRFDEAEGLFLDALSAYSKCEPNLSYLFSQLNCHTELLLRQTRPHDAGRMFLDCLSLFEKGFRGSVYFEDWSICIDTFRMFALKFEAEYEDFETQVIIERLDAMTFTDNDVVEIDTEN